MGNYVWDSERVCTKMWTWIPDCWRSPPDPAKAKKTRCSTVGWRQPETLALCHLDGRHITCAESKLNASSGSEGPGIAVTNSCHKYPWWILRKTDWVVLLPPSSLLPPLLLIESWSLRCLNLTLVNIMSLNIMCEKEKKIMYLHTSYRVCGKLLPSDQQVCSRHRGQWKQRPYSRNAI